MNYSQFYRSPIGPRKMNEEEKTDVGNYSKTSFFVPLFSPLKKKYLAV